MRQAPSRRRSTQRHTPSVSFSLRKDLNESVTLAGTWKDLSTKKYRLSVGNLLVPVPTQFCQLVSKLTVLRMIHTSKGLNRGHHFRFRHAASLQIRATVVMLRFISRAIVGRDLPAALSCVTFPRSVIAFVNYPPRMRFTTKPCHGRPVLVGMPSLLVSGPHVSTLRSNRSTGPRGG